MQHGCELGAGGEAGGVELAVCALQDARAAGPAHSGQRVTGHGLCVAIAGEAGGFTGAHILSAIEGIAVEDGGQLFTRDGRVGAEGSVGVAADDAVLRRPDNRLFIICAGLYVRERRAAEAPRLIFHAVQDRYEHTARRRAVGAEPVAGRAVHQAVFADVAHVIIEPVDAGNVEEVRVRRGIERGDNRRVEFPVRRIAAVANTACRNRDSQIIFAYQVCAAPAGEDISGLCRLVQRDCRRFDGVEIRVAERCAAVQIIGNGISIQRPVRDIAAVSDAARRDGDGQVVAARQISSAPADKRIAGSCRRIQGNGRRFHGIEVRIAGSRTAVQVIRDRVGIQRPVCSVAAVAGAACGNRDGQVVFARQVRAAPARERVSGLCRLIQRDCCRFHGIGRRVAGGSTAVQVIRDRVGIQRPVRGIAAVSDAARRDGDGQVILARQAGAAPAGEGVAGACGVLEGKGVRLDGVGVGVALCRAAVQIVSNGVLIDRPLRRDGHIPGRHGRGDRLVPTGEGIAFSCRGGGRSDG